MSSVTTATVPSSRPKVFRPPAALLSAPPPPPPVQHSRIGIIFPLTAGALLVTCFFIAISHQSPSAFTHSASTDMPSDMKLAEPSIIISPPVSDAAASTLNPEKQARTIALQSQSGAIIGQMAKIPAETEQITEIRPVSEVDKNAGRELLSIVSKY